MSEHGVTEQDIECHQGLVNQHRDRGETLTWMGRAPSCNGNGNDCNAHGQSLVCRHKSNGFGVGDFGGSCWLGGKKALCTSGVPVHKKAPVKSLNDFGCVIHVDDGGVDIALEERNAGDALGVGRYRVVWRYDGPTTSSPMYVRLRLYEVDDLSRDDNCGDLRTEEYGDGKIPYGRVHGEWMQVKSSPTKSEAAVLPRQPSPKRAGLVRAVPPRRVCPRHRTFVRRPPSVSRTSPTKTAPKKSPCERRAHPYSPLSTAIVTDVPRPRSRLRRLPGLP